MLGDIITAIDDDKVNTVQDIVQALDERRIGDEVLLTVTRDGREMQVPVTLQRDR